MEFTALARELRQNFPALRLLENEPMDRHCSFRIGGPAALFAAPASAEELAGLRRFLWQKGVQPAVIGKGTNLLVSDAGIDGVVLHIGEGMDALRPGSGADKDTVWAEAGVSLARLALWAKEQGLTGLEFAHGIPGSLGGGVMMNAGAYGGELRDVVRRVRCLNRQGEIWETSEPGFGYRSSRFAGSGDVILAAELALRPGDIASISATMRELMEKRSASQPLDKPSAGSTFKRPATGYAAALIERAGLKGFRLGGAQVSEKHAGFVINAGGATCADVLRLMEHIQKTVEQRFGVTLEPEVRVIGACVQETGAENEN